MDSGNSGSMQSSSGDEEYDSRAESIPGFLNPPSKYHSMNPDHEYPSISLVSSHHHYQNQQAPTMFDLSSNYLQALSHQPNSNPNHFLLNLDTTTTTTCTSVGSRLSLRSDQPNCTYQLGNLPGGPSSSNAHSTVLASHGPSSAGDQFPGPSSTMQQQLHNNVDASSSGARGNLLSSSSSAQTTVVSRTSKKRTRASRRAPTTVLTTDTSNFRAMVQEFTGIPAPPFSGGSSFSRRLDLFGSGMRSGVHLDATTAGTLYHPLRPSPQKAQPPSLFGNTSSTTMVGTANIATTSNNNNFLSSTSTTSLNYQPSSSDHHHHHHQGLNIAKQPRNILTMQNPIMGFHQSLNPLNPSAAAASFNVPGFAAKPQGNLALSPLEELNASHGYANRGGVTSNQLAVDSDAVLRREDIWRDGGLGSGSGSGSGPAEGNSPRLSGCKLNYVASSSSDQFHPEKGLEINVSSRGEGTVDPWIFPSD